MARHRAALQAAAQRGHLFIAAAGNDDNNNDASPSYPCSYDVENIVCIKEAGGDADRVSQLRAGLPKKFSILSGDDALTLPFMSVGAQGVISVASNLLPKQLTKMVHSYLKGDHKGALKLHEKYQAAFTGDNKSFRRTNGEFTALTD